MTARRTARGAAVALGLLYAWLLAATAPFTVGADVLVALALAVGAGATAAVVVRRRRAEVPAAAAGRGASDGRAGAWWPWIGVLGALVAWELFTYLAGMGPHRHHYPTISSLYDEAARWRAVKACCVVAWVGLGVGLLAS